MDQNQLILWRKLIIKIIYYSILIFRNVDSWIIRISKNKHLFFINCNDTFIPYITFFFWVINIFFSGLNSNRWTDIENTIFSNRLCYGKKETVFYIFLYKIIYSIYKTDCFMNFSDFQFIFKDIDRFIASDGEINFKLT